MILVIKQVYIPNTCLYIIPALVVIELEISIKGLGAATWDKTGLNPGLVPILHKSLPPATIYNIRCIIVL